MNPDYILIKQTVKKTGSPRYIVDILPDGKHREKHISIKDDKGIADAIRHAIEGKLR